MTADPSPPGGEADNGLVRLRAQGLSWRTVDEEIVVLDGDHSVYFAINGAGALLWELLVAGTPTPALVSALVDAYELPPEQATSDVAAFLAMLRDEHLLEDGP